MANERSPFMNLAFKFLLSLKRHKKWTNTSYTRSSAGGPTDNQHPQHSDKSRFQTRSHGSQTPGRGRFLRRVPRVVPHHHPVLHRHLAQRNQDHPAHLLSLGSRRHLDQPGASIVDFVRSGAGTELEWLFNSSDLSSSVNECGETMEMVECQYTSDPKAIMRWLYDAAFWIARKLIYSQ
jgi:hypothetical protein